jgi:hypothetical protein
MASLNILLLLLLGTHVRATIVCVSFDYLLLEHPLNGFLIVWLIFHCQKRHSEEMPITGTDDLAGYFIFYFIFHFSKMRS